MGFTLASVTGRSVTPIDLAPKDKVDFYFKCSPSPDGKGFDTEPALVYCRRHEEARDGRAIDGTLTLGESPLDPIADIPVGAIRSFEFARVATTQTRRGGRDASRPTGCSPTCTSATTTSRSSERRRTDRATPPTSATRSSPPTPTPACRARSTGPYLDARYIAAFDEFLAERHAQRDEQMKLNYDYITNWETTHEEGPARRVRRRSSATRRWTPTASPPR